MTVVEILRGAKKELAKRGLNKGQFFKRLDGALYDSGKPGTTVIPDGPCCVLGACIAAAKNWGADDRVSGYLDTAANVDSIADYNDRPGVNRTHLQAILDRAIALAKKEGK